MVDGEGAISVIILILLSVVVVLNSPCVLCHRANQADHQNHGHPEKVERRLIHHVD